MYTRLDFLKMIQEISLRKIFMKIIIFYECVLAANKININTRKIYILYLNKKFLDKHQSPMET